MTPHAPISRDRARQRLEEAREDIARLLAISVETQQQLHQLIGITSELWEGTQPDEAPEFELQPRLVRSA